MHGILIWNLRGLNNPNKQKELKKVIQEQKAGLCCLLETKIKNDKFSEVYRNMCKDWCIATNFTCCKGGKILLAWLSDLFQVTILNTHSQYIHIKITNIALNFQFHCTMIYGVSNLKGREELWNDLKLISDQIQGPWVVTGDFNNPLNFEDRIGRPISHSEVDGLRECVYHNGLQDLKATGCVYT